MPRYLTSSTLWYSGIFAAAATFDAGIKKERREQWDRAIAGVKQELEQPVGVTKEERIDAREAVQYGFSNKGAVFKPFGTNPEEEEVFRNVDPQQRRPHWPTNTGPALKVDHLPPESIYASTSRRLRLDTMPLSPKKLATVETSIEILLLELFLELETRNWSVEAAEAVPKEFAKNFLQDESALMARRRSKMAAAKRLQMADPDLTDYQPPAVDTHRLCHFFQAPYKLEVANRAVRNLNGSLLELFRLRLNEKISNPFLLAKVAYNISLCSGPPNLKTFNILMLGFSAMEDHVLVDDVISASSVAKMRPNEVTLATILKHYTKTNKPEIFVRWIERMRGKHGGLALARADIEITDGGRSRLIRKPDSPNKIIQLPYATPFVFGPLIAGVIKFAGFETALSICQNMGLEGWGLCMSGLTPLLQDCAERRDWTSGLTIWNQIQALKAISRRKQGSKWMTERIKLDTYAAMLRLCSRCDTKDYFDKIWGKAASVHHNSTDKLVRLVKGEAELELGEETHELADERFEVSQERDSVHAYGSLVEHYNANNALRYSEGLDDHQARYHSYETQETSRTTNGFKDSPEETNARLDDPPRAQSRTTNSLPSQSRLLDIVEPPSSRAAFPPKKAQLLEEELWGLLPSNEELSDYELRERPMTISALPA